MLGGMSGCSSLELTSGSWWQPPFLFMEWAPVFLIVIASLMLHVAHMGFLHQELHLPPTDGVIGLCNMIGECRGMYLSHSLSFCVGGIYYLWSRPHPSCALFLCHQTFSQSHLCWLWVSICKGFGTLPLHSLEVSVCPWDVCRGPVMVEHSA